MLGRAVKSLIIVSRAQGWDPTRILDQTTGEYGQSIENFDKPPNPAGTGDHCVGTLPDGIPDGWPNSYGNPEIGEPSVTWNAPDYGRETSKEGQRGGADPYAGKGKF